jgi:hypothetical protein
MNAICEQLAELDFVRESSKVKTFMGIVAILVHLIFDLALEEENCAMACCLLAAKSPLR